MDIERDVGLGVWKYGFWGRSSAIAPKRGYIIFLTGDKGYNILMLEWVDEGDYADKS